MCVSLKVQPVTATRSAAFTRPEAPAPTTPTASVPPTHGKACTTAARPVAARPSLLLTDECVVTRIRQSPTPTSDIRSSTVRPWTPHRVSEY
jgi:hypothetical protein